jgi:hypothetical protein
MRNSGRLEEAFNPDMLQAVPTGRQTRSTFTHDDTELQHCGGKSGADKARLLRRWLRPLPATGVLLATIGTALLFWL